LIIQNIHYPAYVPQPRVVVIPEWCHQNRKSDCHYSGNETGRLQEPHTIQRTVKITGRAGMTKTKVLGDVA
jgi:hypothetical protein